MKVVIDTNILISAVLRDRDPEAVILFIVQQPDIEWLVTAAILQEYQEVLARPRFGISAADYLEWADLLKTSTVLVDISDTISFPRDPKDAPFLACALFGQADYLITGDADIFSIQDSLPARVVTVQEFKAQVMSRPDTL